MRTVTKVNLILGAILIAVVITALLTYHRPNIQVTVLDPRIHVLSTKILRGTKDDFYIGNQLEGKARDFLRERMHINVAPLYNFGKRTFNFGRPSSQRNATDRLALLFRWLGDEAPPKVVFAELVDSSGTVKRLPSAFLARNGYCCVCDLHDLPQTSEGYRIRFQVGELMSDRPIPGTNLAEVVIRELPPLSPSP